MGKSTEKEKNPLKSQIKLWKVCWKQIWKKQMNYDQFIPLNFFRRKLFILPKKANFS